MRSRLTVLAILLGIGLSSLAPGALAQVDPAETDRMATATSLFEAGQKLVAAGRPAEACPKFEESYRLVEANGTLINLADCYERLGKTASAWLTFRRVAQRSRRDGQSARAQVAEDRAAELTPRLTKLKIGLGPNQDLSGLVVERDGVVVGAAALGVAVPVDPGEHAIVARAPGHLPARRSVIAEGEGEVVTITLPPLEPTARPTPPAADDATDRPWQGPMGIALLSVGGAGVIAGLALGGAAKAKADGADCDADNRCSPEGLTTREDAVTIGDVGTGIGIAGAIVGGLGLTLWLTAPEAEETQAGLRLGPGGAVLQGCF